MKSPSHFRCFPCRALTEIDRSLELMTCANCGTHEGDLVNIVACPRPETYTLPGESWRCSLPFHDYQRDAHVVPWEQREMLLTD